MNRRLRIADMNDAEFVCGVERETMRSYAIETWGVWHEAEARERALENVSAGKTHIVEVDGAAVGILRVERAPSSINLHQVFILPQFQRRGIGSSLLRELMQEARATRIPLKLRVLKVNPAADFYRQLGFAEVDASAEHVYMAYAG